MNDRLATFLAEHSDFELCDDGQKVRWTLTSGGTGKKFAAANYGALESFVEGKTYKERMEQREAVNVPLSISLEGEASASVEERLEDVRKQLHVQEQSSVQSGPEAAEPRAASNFKGRLNELTVADGGVSYTTVPEGDGFRSTVLLPSGSRCRGALPARTKKDAEQRAAEAALFHLEGGGAPSPATHRGAAPDPAAPDLVGAQGPAARGASLGPDAPSHAAHGGAAPSPAAPNRAGARGPAARDAPSASAAPGPAAPPDRASARGPAGHGATPGRPSAAPGPADPRPGPAAGAAAGDASPPQGGAGQGLRPLVLGRLQRAQRGELVALAELARQLAVPKKEVNRVLYALQSDGLARRVVESPPLWQAAA